MCVFMCLSVCVVCVCVVCVCLCVVSVRTCALCYVFGCV